MLTGSIETQRTASHKASSRTPVRAMWTLSLRLHVFTTRVQFSSVYVMWTKPKSSCHRDERWQRTCWVEVSPDICHWRRTGWSRVHSRWTELKFATWVLNACFPTELLTAVELNWTELTCTKLTQLHDELLVTRVSITKLIGCRAAGRALQFSSVQISSSAVNTA